MVQEVVIVAALRTPIGCFNGALAPLHAHEVLNTFQLPYPIATNLVVHCDHPSNNLQYNFLGLVLNI